MQRRSFLKAGGAITLAGLGSNSLLAHVPTHNFDKYDFGSGPAVKDRLYQGPSRLTIIQAGTWPWR